jgi:uncharacterized protein (DUF433 family)
MATTDLVIRGAREHNLRGQDTIGEVIGSRRSLGMNLPEFLTQDADGEIHLIGHRIGLYSVVRVFNEGLSPEEIHEEFPTLAPVSIRDVIAFYLDHRAEVDAYVAAYRAELDRQASAPPGPGLLRLRQRLEMSRLAETS